MEENVVSLKTKLGSDKNEFRISVRVESVVSSSRLGK